MTAGIIGAALILYALKKQLLVKNFHYLKVNVVMTALGRDIELFTPYCWF